MRFPVFARGSNPRVDSPIIRKKLTYLEQQVEAGIADWVDAADNRQGIICRELLYFGPRQEVPAPVPNRLPPIEVSGCRFQLPLSDLWRQEHRRTVLGYELLSAADRLAQER
jgi:hypothetical protein